MGKRPYLIFVCLAVLILVVDILSKWLTQLYLPLGHEGIVLFQDLWGVDFYLSHTTNKGAAWGVFAYAQNYLLVFRIFFIIGLVGYLFFRAPNRSLIAPLMLVLAGATGNVIDYFVYGHVVDMFHPILWGYDFPVFNVADSSIFLGIAWISLQTLFVGKKEPS